MNRLYVYFIKRYGFWWFIQHYLKISSCEKTLKELSKIWNTERFYKFQTGVKYIKPNFSFTQFRQICLNWKNKKPMNYQKEIHKLFKL